MTDLYLNLLHNSTTLHNKYNIDDNPLRPLYLIGAP
jgi:hypothetical protein